MRGVLRYASSSQSSPNLSPNSSRYSSPSVLVPIRPLWLQRPPPRIDEASRVTETRRSRHRRHFHRRHRHRHRCRWGDRLLPRKSHPQNHKYITMMKNKLGAIGAKGSGKARFFHPSKHIRAQWPNEHQKIWLADALIVGKGMGKENRQE